MISIDVQRHAIRKCVDDATRQLASSIRMMLRLHGRMLAQHAREAAHARVNGPAVAAEWRQRLRLAKLGELRSTGAVLRMNHEHQMQRHAEIIQVSQLGSTASGRRVQALVPNCLHGRGLVPDPSLLVEQS